VRAARTPPLQAREIDAFPLYEIRHVASQPSFAISAARRVLRRRLFRVARDGERLAADKGLAREAGSLMFHWAFLILLIGVIIGKGTGFSGRVTVVEGEIPWTDAQANYDSLRAGRFFDGDFTGIGVRLVDFRSDFFRTGVPMDFVSDVEILDPDGNLMRNQAIRVNEPAEVEGLRIYQFGFGWAPVVAVSVDGKAVAGGPIVFVQERAPKGVPQLAVPWRGFLKLPSIEPQAAIEFELWPDSRALVRMLETGEPTPMLTAFDPLMRYMVWRGELTDPSLRSLDTTFMRRAERGVIGGERSASISLGPGGNDDRIRVTFSELRQYSVFQVARDSGVPLVLLAAILVLVGLLPALYTSRRKVWVRAERAADHTVLAVGGFALQRRSQFEEEFARLVRELVAACGGDTSPTSDRSREQVSSP
jgi:cytochrome c biogenesis protein